MADSAGVTCAGLELENGRDLRTEDSTTSKELERSPQDQVTATTNDESSPQSSPKRKPSVPRREGGGSCVQKPRQKTDRKPTLRSRLWNSVKRTVKRNSVVGPSSRGSVDVELIPSAAARFSREWGPREERQSISGASLGQEKVSFVLSHRGKT